ncbi:MAG TPA: peroxide stress protein YaaA [Pseudonocardiaceae bacterium]|nr:peroxide stress protein YaaA [Pseudonocardiaceae bacterium]
MLVLLPPSETKADGGDGGPLDLDRLSFPDLNPVRRKLADALVQLAADVPASIAALGLSARQDAEVARNAALFTAPTVPALRRYTGVLYDALDIGSLGRAGWSRANARLAVASALFGVVRAHDPIPAYRCSGDSVLPGVGPLGGLWRPALEPVLGAVAELVVDLRSGTYATLARLPDAVEVRVVTEVGGRRTTVSHFNKAYKGRLARVLVTARTEPTTVTGLIRIARNAGISIERSGDRVLDLLS